ncbi:transposase [Candidatus Paracaedibacter acanthamoebae]|uniref:transposase n=1 Tax=Candidatus Odyssella acanthamoebae TaxID=91604 RepID=UPI00094ABD8F
MKTLFTEKQIDLALHQAERTRAENVTRHLGIPRATFYRWKAKYGNLVPSEVKRLKQLEEENHKLKQLGASLSKEIDYGLTPMVQL